MDEGDAFCLTCCGEANDIQIGQAYFVQVERDARHCGLYLRFQFFYMLPLPATVRYTSRAGITGHKLATWKTGLVIPRLSKLLMGLRFLVGARGFEPPTSRSQTERTTRLCYAPNANPSKTRYVAF